MDGHASGRTRTRSYKVAGVNGAPMSASTILLVAADEEALVRVRICVCGHVRAFAQLYLFMAPVIVCRFSNCIGSCRDLSCVSHERHVKTPGRENTRRGTNDCKLEPNERRDEEAPDLQCIVNKQRGSIFHLKHQINRGRSIPLFAL